MTGEPKAGGKINRIVTHAAVAGAFFFVLQHFIMHESLQISLLWAGFFAAAGGMLAWQQSSR